MLSSLWLLRDIAPAARAHPQAKLCVDRRASAHADVGDRHAKTLLRGELGGRDLWQPHTTQNA